MKKLCLIAGLSVLVVAAFLLGSWQGRQQTVSGQVKDGPNILYYVDPMNPAHTSDKPGLAPCGMKMEPVYADAGSGPGSAASAGPMPSGTVRVSLERQQLIGVRVGEAKRQPLQHTLRLLGRVAPDATRVYRINAGVDGWIVNTRPLASGSYVKRDEALAAFYSPEFLGAARAFLFALGSRDRVQNATPESGTRSNQAAPFEANLQQSVDSLKSLGMGEAQIERIRLSRTFDKMVDMVAPANGFITVRNVSDGQRFERGEELYRLADLSRVWILADVFEKEARLMPARLQARVSLPEQTRTFTATLTETLPQFDGVSRTLKLRFEAENPEFVLKPDMFVDVELPVSLPEAIVVPSEAMLDTGLRKTVFVDRGNGYFEPRVVQTGAQLANQVQILHGLTPGERIVVSGTFLLDSESRMKLAAAGVHSVSSIDPVCGMKVNTEKATAANRFSAFGGKNYYFCNDGCKAEFDTIPREYLKETTQK